MCECETKPTVTMKNIALLNPWCGQWLYYFDNGSAAIKITRISLVKYSKLTGNLSYMGRKPTWAFLPKGFSKHLISNSETVAPFFCSLFTMWVSPESHSLSLRCNYTGLKVINDIRLLYHGIIQPVSALVSLTSSLTLMVATRSKFTSEVMVKHCRRHLSFWCEWVEQWDRDLSPLLGLL